MEDMDPALVMAVGDQVMANNTVPVMAVVDMVAMDQAMANNTTLVVMVLLQQLIARLDMERNKYSSQF